jgi:hypothetical protein
MSTPNEYISDVIAKVKAYVLANMAHWGIGAFGTLVIQFVLKHLV